MRYNPQEGAFILDKAEGALPSRFNHLEYILHGFEGLTQVKINGENKMLKDTTYNFLGLPAGYALDALPDLVKPPFCSVKTLVTENVDSIILLKYLQ